MLGNMKGALVAPRDSVAPATTGRPPLVVVLPMHDTARAAGVADAALGFADRLEVVTLSPEVLWADEILKDKARAPKLEEAAERGLVGALVERFPGSTFMPLGSLATQAFMDHQGHKHDGFLKTLGRTWRQYPVGVPFVPNYDPAASQSFEGKRADFRRILWQAAHPEKMRAALPVEDRARLLDFAGACAEIDKIIAHHASGMIDHVVFDIETSSLNAWEGEIIMYSWAHDMDPCGYAVPLFVNNEVQHKDTPYKIPQVDFTITPDQRAALDAKVGELLRKVPIVGHNLKFDIKFCHWHQVAHIKDITIKDDTYVQAYLLYGRQAGQSLGLKALAQKCLGAEEWEAEKDDWLGRFQLLRDRHFANIPTGLLWKYAALDTYWNRELYAHLRSEAAPTKNLPVVVDLLTRAVKVFAEMELKGIKIDEPVRAYQEDQYRSVSEDIEVEIRRMPTVRRFIVDRMTPRLLEEEQRKLNPRCRRFYSPEEIELDAFNLRSAPQMKELVYGDKYYGLPVMEKFTTETGQGQVNKLAIAYFVDKLMKVGDSQRDEDDKRRKRQLQDLGVFDALAKLGLDPNEDFNEDVIKRAYHATAMGAHPDRGGDEEEMKAVNAAYERLGKVLEALMSATYSKDKIDETVAFLKLLRRYKRVDKLVRTYLTKMIAGHTYEGLYRPEFSHCSTITGRVGSGFHTMDNGSDVKRVFVSRWRERGGLFLAPDFSQLELRVGASLSGEDNMIEAFIAGADMHRITASKMYGLAPGDVSHEQRQNGKTLNFSVFFGKTERGLADQWGIELSEAQKFINGFFRGNPKLGKWIRGQKDLCKRYGFIVTPWGRMIRIENSQSHKRWEVEAAERQSVNYPVQSSATDIGIWSVVTLADRFAAQGFKSLLVGTVHDSIEVDVYPGELPRVLALFKEVCEAEVRRAHPWILCPLEISFEVGTSWGGGVEVAIEEAWDGGVLLKASGASGDIRRLVSDASLAYQVAHEVLEVERVKNDNLGDEKLVRDPEKWTSKIRFS